MIIWVLYDIKEDRARNKASKYCKQAGLYRVQYSAFLGSLDANQRDTLSLQLQSQIDETEDKVYILPMTHIALIRTKVSDFEGVPIF
jgi:CRISPR-associated protein Cas2